MSSRLNDEKRALPLGSLIFLLFVVLVPVALGAAPKIFGDGDVSWHLAAGQWIIANGRIPQVDPFSFTMGGRPWVAFEWLSQVIYASAFAAAGYRGMAVAVMAALVALHFAIFTFLARRASPLAMVAAFVAMDIVLASFLLARPHLLVWPILATWTAILLDCRDQGRPPPLWLALLMLVWANLHGSFILGFAIAGAIALDALIAARWNRRVFFAWLNFGLAALILALLNANGLTGFLHPIRVMGMENLAFIDEWQPSTLRLTPFFFVVLAGTLGAILLKGVKLTVGETLLLVALTIMAFGQVRHQSWLAIVAPLILVPRLSRDDRASTDRLGWSLKLGLAASAILLTGLVLPPRPVESAGNPRGLLAHVPAELRGKPVLNGYSFGGPLILAGIRPYIDGRSDMYGDAFVADYFKIRNGDRERFKRAACKYGIAWTMLPPKTGLVAVLDASSEWNRIYADRIGVIHVRQAAPRC
jgi:hypothetical protein